MISVTADHIKNGKCRDAYACPVALAINDAIEGAKAGVGGPYILFNFNGIREITLLPDSVKNFTEKFDSGQPVEPFEFELTWMRGLE